MSRECQLRTPRTVPVRVVLLFALLVTTLGPSASAQRQPPAREPAQEPASDPQERTFSGRAQVTAVDLVVEVTDETGRVPQDLSPEDFAVLEDGKPQPVVGVATFGPGGGSRSPPAGGARAAASAVPSHLEWHTAVYLDQILTSTSSMRRATQALAGQAGRLTDLGTVEIVVADPHPRQLLAPTRSGTLVEQKLLQLSRELAGRDELTRIRRGFVEFIRLQQEVAGRGATNLGTRVNQIWSSVLQEERLLRVQHDNLLAWAASSLAEGPKSLLLVSDGYDLDPQDFYLVGIADPGVAAETASLVREFSPLSRFHQMTRVLAAEGWVCVNVALSDPSVSFLTTAAEAAGRGRMGDLGRDQTESGTDLPRQLFFRPFDGLRNLAEETGGELVRGPSKIPEALAGLAERVVLTYQVERLPDGKLHAVEVRPLREGLRVRAPDWSGSPAPDAVASARARRLLADGRETGDLPLVAAVGIADRNVGLRDRSDGALQVRVDLAGFPPGTLPETSNLRVTFAVALGDQIPFVRQDVVEGQRLDGVASWTYTVPISVPPEAESIAVVVEDLTTGFWGGTLASEVEGPLPPPPAERHTSAIAASGVEEGGRGTVALGEPLPMDLLPEPKVLALVAPAGEMHTGDTRFEALVTSRAVDRVAFYLDGERARTADRPPFAAHLDLGRLPRPRTVEAVALDRRGEELGRDSLVVNRGAGSFRVRLIEPRLARQVGPVDVEAEVQVPADDALDRVELSWNGETVATLHAPPFRQRVIVPPESPEGFIGVTAFLTDGSTAEDVVFMNGPGGDERVEVSLVEVMTVVTDPSGHPVVGLAAVDFRVSEDGRRQEIAAVRPGAEMPLSLGLLLDSSASMADSMRRVQTAAIDFLYLTLEEEDRAFFVDFDTVPKLAQSLTGDLEAVGRKIVRTRADGYTALSDALVFGLVHTQSVPGRRALVVFSDGAGREERVPWATSLRVAQQVGVPIYAVILDRDGSESTRAGRLQEVVAAVGGRVFFVESLARLGDVYRRIGEELDAQYLLTYYPADRPAAAEGGAGVDEFRRVDVEVLRPGLSARTVAGYWP